MNGRERIFAMLEGRSPDCLPAMPITMMFAADQIGAKYLDYATDYRTLAQAQLLVAGRFDIDHVSVISDPGCEPADLGATIRFFPDQPPAIDEENALLKDKTKLSKLKPPDPSSGARMSNRLEAVRSLKNSVRGEKAVEGWIEGPCAEAADLRGINRLMVDFYDDPKFVRDLMTFAVEMELGFARAQIDAGVEIMGIGDSAASLVGPRFYYEFVWPQQKRMVDEIHAMDAWVRLHICGNTRPLQEGLGRLGCDILDEDSLVLLNEGRSKMGPDQILLGNIDPVRVLRDGTPESVFEAIADCHRQAGSRYIVGAGCEVPRDTPAENMRAMIVYARSHQPAPGTT